jgi:2-(1,2-epoxy-1,2-dihydrophenyl)acetyl-CoA isomerase
MDKLIEVIKHGKFIEVALNRPEVFNAFNPEMISELANVLMKQSIDNTLKGVVITGRGRAFCAGGDLRLAVDFYEKPSASFYKLARQVHLSSLEIRRMNKPVVAAINGAAAGAGFSLALACDFRIMEASAVFQQAYTSNGFSIDGGCSFTLPRIVGFARALEIAAFDRPIPAKQALEWGLATKVVEDGAALKEAIDMLNEVARNSIHSFGWSKKLINESFSNSLESHLGLERESLSECANHPDGKEGLKAFIEKRKPVFNC